MVTLEQNKIINGNGKGEKKINRLARKCVVDLITWREWLLALCKMRRKESCYPCRLSFQLRTNST